MQHARAATPTRTLQFASLSFDVSFQEMFSTWSAGGTLVLADEEVRQDARALLRALSEQRIERLFLPYVALQYLSEVAAAEGSVPESLRQVITAGEQLKITPSIRQLFERLGGCTLDNQYGPSETHVVSGFMLDDPARDWPELPPIGRPIDNTRLYILDTRMQPVPLGVTGELYVGGVAAARGYLRRADVTAERFEPDPFAAETGARLYRTGDLARHLPDGNIEFLGRSDLQVKVRGYRIEPGEVEAALRRYEEVREAVVKAHDSAGVEKQLVAYLLVEPGSELQPAELRSRLKEQLPAHMVPSAFVFLHELPLTPSGKIDRRALNVPEHLLHASSDEYVAPGTPYEEMLAGIWAEVLNVERVSATDNFFDLGGHSLLATRVMSRVRKVFGVELPLRRLFETPTVSGLAETVAAALAAGPEQEPLPPIERASRTDVAPLSFEQQRLWLWDQFNPGGTIYNLTSAFLLRGKLDVKALEQSLNEVVRRHETLRTTFRAGRKSPTQVVNPFMPFALPLTDLSGLPERERGVEMERQAEAQSRHVFDLARGPLLLAGLFRLSEDEHLALLTMHHIISDGWSAGVLLDEVRALYEAFAAGQPSPLAELPIQYADFALWQRRWMESEAQQQQLDYWKQQLDPMPLALELPFDHERPPMMNFRGDVIQFSLPPELNAELLALSRREGVTLYMTLLAAFKTLLHRYSSQTDIIVGADVANRHHVETEKLIGFFVNMLVLRTNLSGDPTFSELLQRVREVTLGGYAHQHIPFASVVNELNVKREWNRNPLFQVVFVLQNAPLGDLDLSGLTLSPVPLKSETSPFDMVVSLTETRGGIEGVLVYSRELFERATMERLLTHYRNLLEGIVAEPDQRLSGLRLLGHEETMDYSTPDFMAELSRGEMENLLLEINELAGGD